MPSIPPLALHPFAGQDIRTLIALRAATRKDHPFLVWEPFEGAGFAWTYGEFAERVARFAAGLRLRGRGGGDHQRPVDGGRALLLCGPYRGGRGDYPAQIRRAPRLRLPWP